MRTTPHRRRQRGSVAIIAVVTIPVIAIILLGVIVLGRVMITRQRLQFAADAMAADGALMSKREGLTGASRPNSAEGYAWLPSTAALTASLTSARDGNLALVGTPAWPTWTFETVNGVEWSRSEVHLETTIATIRVTAAAAMRMAQLRTSAVRRRPPTLMLVLDYSASMNRRSNAFGVAITQQRQVVTNFLDGLPQDDLLVGAITFGGGVYDVVPPSTRRDSGNFLGIRQVVAKPASGDTATGPAINAALSQLLAAPENFGRNIILVSDGEPCCADDAEPAALAAAANARSKGVQLITVEVQHVDSSPHMHDVLLQISGSAAYHYEAENAAALNALFQGVSARPLCDVTITGDTSDAFAFLRNENAREERPLQRFSAPEDMACPEHCAAYGFRTDGPLVIFSPAACEDVFAGRRSALVRWGKTTLSM